MVEFLSVIKRNNTAFGVTFIKRSNGKERAMHCQFRSKDSERTKGGHWADGRAGRPEDHNLLLVTDIQLKNQGKPAYRTIGLESIRELRTRGRAYRVVD